MIGTAAAGTKNVAKPARAAAASKPKGRVSKPKPVSGRKALMDQAWAELIESLDQPVKKPATAGGVEHKAAKPPTLASAKGPSKRQRKVLTPEEEEERRKLRNRQAAERRKRHKERVSQMYNSVCNPCFDPLFDSGCGGYEISEEQAEKWERMEEEAEEEEDC